MLTVAAAQDLSPRLRRITLRGDDLAGFVSPLPAASVRVLLPAPGAATIVLPEWNGNEFLTATGARPPLRTLTPGHHDADGGTLDVDVVVHGDTPLSRWATTAAPGSPVALSGPGRGYEIDVRAPGFLLAGDESALPALAQLLELLPETVPVTVLIEVARPEGRLALPDRPGTTVRWLDLPAGAAPGTPLVDAVAATTVPDGGHVWVAGEAAAVQAIRRHLFAERGVDRSRAVIRGYWKHGRDGAQP